MANHPDHGSRCVRCTLQFLASVGLAVVVAGVLTSLVASPAAKMLVLRERNSISSSSQLTAAMHRVSPAAGDMGDIAADASSIADLRLPSKQHSATTAADAVTSTAVAGAAAAAVVTVAVPPLQPAAAPSPEGAVVELVAPLDITTTPAAATAAAVSTLSPAAKGSAPRASTPDFIFCGDIRDTLGSALAALTGFLAFTRAFQMQTGHSVLVQLPPLPIAQRGGFLDKWHDAKFVSLLDFVNFTLLNQSFQIDSSRIDYHQSCSMDTSDLGVGGSGVHLRSLRLGRQPSSVVTKLDLSGASKRCKPMGFDRNTFLCHMQTLTNAFHHFRKERPLVVFFEAQWRAGRLQDMVTLFHEDSLFATHAVEFLPVQHTWSRSSEAFPTATGSWAPSERTRQDIAQCAYVFIREKIFKPEGPWFFTGPNPDGGVHCALCPHFGVTLPVVGVALGKLLHDKGLACVKINLYGLSPDHEHKWCDKVTGAAKKAGYPFQASIIHKNDVAPVEEEKRAASNLAMLQIAAHSPLFITERGSLWSDLVVNRRIASGKPTAVLWSKKYNELNVDELDTPNCLVIRGQCVPEGVNPYPGKHGTASR
eukprot:TRINITY_DN43966_c0_g1_i1.p1 TRINITY_DN43966_c0_g1~~TRINITY_DN43966_c0_g1_i1.p1  ORF type:complete len:592 (-),score=97.07 TRINITY_DN43966_c0_g1_i1:647-2422(-)